MQRRNERLRRVISVCLSMTFFCGLTLGQTTFAEEVDNEATGAEPTEVVAEDSEARQSTNVEAESEVSEAELEEVAGLTWHTDYMEAYRAAKLEERMLLVNFIDNTSSGTQSSVEQTIANSEGLQSKLKLMVLLRVPQDELIELQGESKPLLQQGAFTEMHGRPGIAIIDLENEGESYYGHVVSAYPFTSSKYYRWQPNYLHSIVDLPPGTITQRTMVWAVKIHPERPASVEGVAAEPLLEAAESHCHHQASIGVQGHHQWDSRFHQVRYAVGASDASEVVAESWPNQTMIDSCIDCVDSWRQSSGHWGAVKRRHRMFGYDIKRGRNGIWYGTGIFAN